MTSVPCPFGVVFALGIEAAGLEALLRNDDRHVVIVRSGPGRQRAAAATEALLDEHRPAVVVSAGFAGGLDPKLRRGDIVVADRILDESGRQCSIDLAALPPAATGSAHVGCLLTVDRIICSAAKKRAWVRNTVPWRPTWKRWRWPRSAAAAKRRFWPCG